MQETPNLQLKTYGKADGDVKFLDYRLAQSENFEKLDEAVGQSSSDIANLAGELASLSVKTQTDFDSLKAEIDANHVENKQDDDDIRQEIIDLGANLQNNIDNHTHTKDQIGLGLVENYPIATVDEAMDGTATDRYMTPFLVAEMIKWGGGVPYSLKAVELKQSITSSYTTMENQKEIDIPFQGFDTDIHLLEIRVGGVPFFHERYTISNNKVVLNSNEIGFAKDKRIDFVVTYLEQVGDNRLPVHGKNLHDGSVAYDKLSDEVKNMLNSGGLTDAEKQAIYDAINSKADVNHTHDALEQAVASKADANHTHVDLENEIAGKANLVHTHSDYASTSHASTHGVGGSDELQVVEEMLSDDLKRKINTVSSGGCNITQGEVATIKQDISDAQSDLTILKSDASAMKTEIAGLKTNLDEKANKTEVEQELNSIRTDIGNKANASHTHTASNVGALALTGGTLTGDVTITHTGYPRFYVQRGTGQGVGCLEGGANNVNIEAINEVGNNSNRRVLALYNSAGQSNISNAIRMTDYINGTSKNYLIYGEHNKPRFRQIADLGLTDSDFSTTDIGANIYKIVYAMGKYCILGDACNSTTTYANLYASILAKAKTDLGVTSFGNNEFSIQLEAGNGANMPNLVRIRDNQTYKEYAFLYDRSGSTDNVGKMEITIGAPVVTSTPNACVIGSIHGGLDMALASSTSASATSNAEIKSQVGGWKESSGAVIVPETGNYLITINGGLETTSGSVNNSNGISTSLTIMKNGSTNLTKISSVISNISSSGYGTKWIGLNSRNRYTPTQIVSLSAGDKLTFKANISSYYNNTALTVGVKITGSASITKL